MRADKQGKELAMPQAPRAPKAPIAPRAPRNAKGQFQPASPSKGMGSAKAKTYPKPNKASRKASAEKKASDKRAPVRRPFPKNTLEEALAVPLGIKEKNNGKPFETDNVAK